ncbi:MULTISPECIES: hypothetical protein [unclassified Rhizobacter]|uniref:hypothetical protein n=1 Tax=unclassified Rhizobacter TaxID=2640088 RepID=UPI0006F50343|nr:MULTISPECIES: hypothetical protein [unclassified Rhizobacter]KQU65052.1 hypothetical protein ASC88_11715 [Rhizobacter sp. Root29]KQW02770.1 hypothetical protein ASC98_28045 [Rhizobacter sp. Root1238]KRB15588.1 hypothetical protein ASE08_27020 [Rhizobacter sp. Root16D2]
MKRIEVDFVRRQPPGPAWWGLAVLLLVAAFALVAWGWVLRADAADLRSQIRQSDERANALALQASRRSEAPVQPPPAYAADANAALRLQRMPLDAALASLEAVGTVGVLPVSVDVNAADAMVRVQVEFSTYEALLKYLEDLNAGEPSERWSLATAQGTGLGATGRPTALIVSRWRGGQAVPYSR